MNIGQKSILLPVTDDQYGGESCIKELVNNTIHSCELQYGAWYNRRTCIAGSTGHCGTCGEVRVNKSRLSLDKASAAVFWLPGMWEEEENSNLKYAASEVLTAM